MPITVLIAGTSKVTDGGDLSSGGSAWFGENDPRNRSIGVPTYLHSKNSGELAAILSVIQTTPVEIGLNFKLKSVHLIRKLTIDLPVHEQNGWTSDRDRVLLSSIVAALRGRGSRTSFCEVQDEDHFEHVKCLSDLGLFEEPEKLNTDIPRRYRLQGLSLAGTSQAMFYRAIRESKKFPERIKTTIMLDLTRYAVRAQCNIVPTDEMIWRSIRNKDISRNIRDFLWRCLHDSYKCGVYWRNIPGFEQFATCHFCGADENVEHVLVECADDPARISIWDLCTQLWEMKHQKMSALSIGLILGSALCNSRIRMGDECVKQAAYSPS
jgi:ribonuclease HI